jgi:hypothetical protein
MTKLLFMGHSKGDTHIDGKPVKWDNIMLSNGKRTAKIQNSTGRDNFEDLKPEQDYVNCAFDVQPDKGETFSVKLVKIEPVK